MALPTNAIPSGVVSYVISIPAASYSGVDGDLFPALLGSYSVYTDKVNPYTGNKIQGWQWDKTSWPSNELTFQTSVLPSLWDPSVSGLDDDFFQSGIGDNDDLKYLGAGFVPSSGVNREHLFNLWAPLVNHGQYFDFNDPGYLFSDDSRVYYATLSGIAGGLNRYLSSGLNVISLDVLPKPNVPIRVVQYGWDESDGTYYENLVLRKKIHFTGLRDSTGARQSTYDSQKQVELFHLLDGSSPEFIVSYSGVLFSGANTQSTFPKVILNNQFVNEIGSLTTSGTINFQTTELLGISDGSSSQQFHTKYSPIDTTQQFDLFSWITVSGTAQRWDVVSSGVSLSGYQALLDRDLGVVEFGSLTVSGQNVPTAGSYISAHYWKTVRVECEPIDTKDYVTGLEANLNPIYRQSNRGFVYLSRAVDDPVSITLEALLPELASNEYGPLNIGNNYAALIATVKGKNSLPLEDQSVTFTITSTPTLGSFSGSSTEITASTDKDGKAKVYYYPPRSIADISEDVSASGVSINNSPGLPGITQTTTITTNSLLIDGDETDIYLYKVEVDDPTVGFLSTSLDVDDLQTQVTEYYRQYLTSEVIYGPTGQSTSGVLNSRAAEWEDSHRLLWSLTRPTIYEDDKAKGRRTLMTTYSVSGLNPHTLESGVFIPAQPFQINSTGATQNELVYDTSTYTIPVPSGNHYRYGVVAPTSVDFKAKVLNDRSNRYINSNEIEVKLDIPSHMNGLWNLTALNDIDLTEVHSLLDGYVQSGMVTLPVQIPLGFRVRSNSVTLAAALDGVTFLDVNPLYNRSNFPVVRHQVTVSGIH